MNEHLYHAQKYAHLEKLSLQNALPHLSYYKQLNVEYPTYLDFLTDSEQLFRVQHDLGHWHQSRVAANQHDDSLPRLT